MALNAGITESETEIRNTPETHQKHLHVSNPDSLEHKSTVTSLQVTPESLYKGTGEKKHNNVDTVKRS